MQLRNTHKRFGLVGRLFHWLTALLLIGSFTLGLSMVDLELSPTKFRLYAWHKWIGVTVFLVTFLRVLWRLGNPVPSPPDRMPRWQHQLAGLSHAALYGLLVAMPITGWLMSSALDLTVVYFGVVELPDLVAPDRALGESLKRVHVGLSRIFLAVIAVHVLAALYHHFYLKDDVLRRMLVWPKGWA